MYHFFRKADLKRSFILITAINFFVLLFITSCFFSNGTTEMNAPDEIVSDVNDYEIVQSDKDKRQETGSTDGSDSPSNAGTIKKDETHKVAYLAITVDERSKHFEHRVANIYAVNPDGTENELIYSDIDEKYDLSKVYNPSPDGNKLACLFQEGGRGAYSGLYILDIRTGKISIIAEFDYTQDDMPENTLTVYGEPVWSNDSSMLYYEIISIPFERPLSGNHRDVGLFCADVDTAKSFEIDIELGGASVRSTIFLNPVLISPDDKDIYLLEHIYSPIEEGGEILGFREEDFGLYKINKTGGNGLEKVFLIEDLANVKMSSVLDLNNFRYLENENKIVFDALGDFEEDGDIWICGKNGEDISRLTDNPVLRESQPTVYGGDESDSLVSYNGAVRYGTVVNNNTTGDLYIINVDGSGNKKITDYGIGVSAPIFSPEGRYISYMFSTFDEYEEYIISNHIEIYDLEKDKKIDVGQEVFSITNIGWISNNK